MERLRERLGRARPAALVVVLAACGSQAAAPPDSDDEVESAPAEVPVVEASPDVRLGDPAAAGERLELQLLGPRGEPLADARVLAFRDQDVLGEGRTDAEGWVRLGTLDGPGYLALVPKGQVPLHQPSTLAGVQRLRYPRGETVAGRLLVGDAPPEGPLEVTLRTSSQVGFYFPRSVHRALGSPPKGMTVLETRTDPQGRFRFEGLPAGARHVLSVESKPLSRPGPDLPSTALHVAGDHPDLLLRIVEGVTMYGGIHVKQGSPLDGHEVSLWVDGEEVSVPYSLETGVFSHRVRELPQRVELWVRHVETGRVERFAAFTEPLEDHLVHLGEFNLLGAQGIAVRLIDTEGRPVAGVELGDSKALTDEDGRAWIDPRYESWEVEAHKDGFTSGTRTRVDGLQVVEMIRLAHLDVRGSLQPPGSARHVRLRLESHGGVHDSSVYDLPQADTPLDAELDRMQGTDSSDLTRKGILLWWLASANGVRVRDVHPGHRLSLSVVDSRGHVILRRDLPPLEPGEHRKVSLDVEWEPVYLRVRFQDEEGTPIAGGLVLMDGEQLPGSSDGDGLFTTMGLFPTEVDLSLRHIDYDTVDRFDFDLASAPQPLTATLARRKP